MILKFISKFQRSGKFTMATFNDTMKQKYKQKYTNNQEKKFEDIKQKIVQQQINKFDNQLQKESVLSRFRKAVFQKQNITHQSRQLAETLQNYDKQLKNILATGTKQQQIKKSKKLVQRFINNKQIFNVKSQSPVIDDYGDYDVYKSNYSHIVQKRSGDYQPLNAKRYQRGYKFIESLGSQYTEKRKMQQALRDTFHGRLTFSQYAKRIQTQAELIETANLKNTAKPRAPASVLTTAEIVGSDTGGDVYSPGSLNNGGRLSPGSCEKIYQLYLEGWKVRDISKRFGILPNRTKVIIWSRAYFYTQILPRSGFKCFLKVLQKQAKYGVKFGYIDYGVDLKDLGGDGQMSNRITVWNNSMIDIARQTDLQRYDKAVEKLQKHRLFDRYKMITLKTHGKHNHLYFIKDWKIYRGKGSDYWHLSRHTFKKLFKTKGRDFYQ